LRPLDPSSLDRDRVRLLDAEEERFVDDDRRREEERWDADELTCREEFMYPGRT
jgi:hypothetical protein